MYLTADKLKALAVARTYRWLSVADPLRHDRRCSSCRAGRKLAGRRVWRRVLSNPAFESQMRRLKKELGLQEMRVRLPGYSKDF